jgi:predicted lipoprotein
MEKMAGRRSHSWVLLGGLSAWAALQPVVGCKGGTTDSGDSVVDSPIVVQLLETVGPGVILPALESFQVETLLLSDALADLEESVLAGEDTSELEAAAQDQWMSVMGAWAQLDVMQIGPQASSLSAVSGGDIRDEIYSWPSSVNPCRVDQITADNSYEDADFFTANLINGYGLDALEHLLFSDLDTPCPAQVPPLSDGSWEELGEEGINLNRARYAQVLSAHLETQVVELIDTWSPEGENYSGQLARTTENTPYASDQESLNAVFDALFFLEKTTKDVKLAKPMGLMDCSEETCPDDVEGQLSGTSLISIEGNILGFRALFHGADGVGLDDLLIDVGHGDLAAQITTDLDEALEALDALEGPLDEAIVERYDEVESFYTKLQDVTSALKGDLATVLALQIPSEAAGDND